MEWTDFWVGFLQLAIKIRPCGISYCLLCFKRLRLQYQTIPREPYVDFLCDFSPNRFFHGLVGFFLPIGFREWILELKRLTQMTFGYRGPYVAVSYKYLPVEGRYYEVSSHNSHTEVSRQQIVTSSCFLRDQHCCGNQPYG